MTFSYVTFHLINILITMTSKGFLGIVISLFLLASCRSSTSPSESVPITFPTSSDITLRYADFIDTTGTGRNYDSIGVIDERIVGTRMVSGRMAFLHQNILTTADTVSIDTTLYAYDNNNQDQWIFLSSIDDFIGVLDERFNLRGFTPGWYPYLKTSEPIGRNYTILAPTPLTLQLDTLTITATARAVGNVRGRESITVQGKTYNTTKLALTLTLQARFGTITLPDVEILQQVWCADNIGIVKFETSSATLGLPPLFSFVLPSTKQELISVIRN